MESTLFVPPPPPVTVSVVEPEMFSEVAVIVVVPADTAVAFPIDPAELLIVTIELAEELQDTNVVMSCMLLSEYAPVAVNCSVIPRTIEGLAGVTVIETIAGGATVMEVEPEILPDLAVIVAVPTVFEVVFPFDPAVLPIVATDLAEELQVTDVVRSRVLLSE
jgi:hypothetical protein